MATYFIFATHVWWWVASLGWKSTWLLWGVPSWSCLLLWGVAALLLWGVATLLLWGIPTLLLWGVATLGWGVGSRCTCRGVPPRLLLLLGGIGTRGCTIAALGRGVALLLLWGVAALHNRSWTVRGQGYSTPIGVTLQGLMSCDVKQCPGSICPPSKDCTEALEQLAKQHRDVQVKQYLGAFETLMRSQHTAVYHT
jgi:hypothetical protein